MPHILSVTILPYRHETRHASVASLLSISFSLCSSKTEESTLFSNQLGKPGSNQLRHLHRSFR